MTSYRLIQLKDVYDDRLHLEELKSIEIHQRSIERYILQEGDVIINARGLPTRIAVVPPHDQTLILSQISLVSDQIKTFYPIFFEVLLRESYRSVLFVSGTVH